MTNSGNIYNFRVEPQDVDFTLRSTIASIVDNVLNIAGVDAQRNGFGVDSLMKSNWSWVLSRIAIELDFRPGQFSGYTIRTWVNYDGRVLSTRNFVLADERGEVFGRVLSQWAMIDFGSRHPVDLRQLADSYTAVLSDEAAPCERPRKLTAVEADKTFEHRIVYSDIDFNNHVNTMRYLELMVDMLPIETFAIERPVRIDLHFIKESVYGQTLRVGYAERDNRSLFEIGTDDGTTVCRGSFEWRC